MQESNVKWIVGVLVIPLLIAIIGLIPFFYTISDQQGQQDQKDDLVEHDTIVVTKPVSVELIDHYVVGMNNFKEHEFTEARRNFSKNKERGPNYSVLPLAYTYLKMGVEDYRYTSTDLEILKEMSLQGIRVGDKTADFGLWLFHKLNRSRSTVSNEAIDDAIKEIKNRAIEGQSFWQNRLCEFYLIREEYSRAEAWAKASMESEDPYGECLWGLIQIAYSQMEKSQDLMEIQGVAAIGKHCNDEFRMACILERKYQTRRDQRLFMMGVR